MYVPGRKLRTITEAFEGVQKQFLLIYRITHFGVEFVLCNFAHLFHAQTVTFSTKGS